MTDVSSVTECKAACSCLANLPLGVFDSGVGGLTVLSALHRAMPNESLLYLGDTARLPYGTKSTETIQRYAVQAAQKLVERQVKMLVIACNTATASALPSLQEAFPGVPIIGVVEPGARAACTASVSGNILVLGTESTIKNQAYQKAITAIRPESKVTGIACSLFVPLAEEGWIGKGEGTAANKEKSIAASIAERYIAETLNRPCSEKPDCIVLGCTHFPPLAPILRTVVGEGIAFVDSAETTAQAVKEELSRLDILRKEPTSGTLKFLTTDAPERFSRVGGVFFGEPIAPDSLELVSL